MLEFGSGSTSLHFMNSARKKVIGPVVRQTTQCVIRLPELGYCIRCIN